MNPLAIEILVVDDDALGTVTVADVLRNPDAFIGETLTDPLEGPSYGPCISCRICSSLRMGFRSNKMDTSVHVRFSLMVDTLRRFFPANTTRIKLTMAGSPKT
jgi:hypothetical protein